MTCGADDRLTVLYGLAYPHRFNGAQRGLHTIAAGMRERGHRVIIVVPAEGRATVAFRDDGFDVRRLPVAPELNRYGGALARSGLVSKLRTASGLFRSNVRVARLARAEGVDLVHCAEARAALVFGFGARLSCRPLVVHVVGGPGTFPRALRHVTAASATRLVLVADQLRASVPFAYRHKAVTVRRGAARPALERGAPSVPGARLRLLQLASLDRHKGQHHLVEAVSLLPSPLRETVDVVLLGDTVDEAYERHVLALASELGVSTVERMAWRPDPETEILRADVIVHPSVERELLSLEGRTALVRSAEGVPNSLIEAGLAGKPAIGTRVAGIPEVLEHERTGLIVEQGDAAQLAAAIERLAGSRAYRAQLGENARALVRARFDPELALDAMERVYRAGCAREGPAARRLKRYRSHANNA